MATKTGPGVQQVLADTGCQKGEVRYSTRQIGLRNALKPKYRGLVETLQDTSARAGLYAYVVSLVANFYAITHPDEPIVKWKTFYDQIWSALDGHQNRFTTVVDDLFARIGTSFSPQLTPNEVRGKLPPKIRFELRQNETADMKKSADAHFKLFTYRLHRHLVAQCIECMLRCSATPVTESQFFRAIWHCALAAPSELSVAWAKVERTYKQHTVDDGAALVGIRSVIDAERSALGDLLHLDGKVPRYVVAAHRSEVQSTLLPHLKRYSDAANDWWCQHGDTQWHRAWQKESHRPKPFSLLPICKLQPRHIQYSWTQLEIVLRDVAQLPPERTQERTVHSRLDALRRLRKTLLDASPSGKKRKRGDGQCLTNPMAKKWLAALIARRIATAEAVQRKLQLDVLAELFDMRKLKGKCRKTGQEAPPWRLCQFSTDGVKLCMLFASGVAEQAPNAACLVKQGYNLPVPKQPIDVLSTPRGLYHLKEGNEVKTIQPTTSAVRFKVIDPGIIKPLECGTLCLSDCSSTTNVAKMLLGSDHSWHMTEEEWKQKSGRKTLERMEERFRAHDAGYAAAVGELRNERKKCSDETAFVSYCTAAFRNLEHLQRGNLCIDRSKINWWHCRRSISFIARVADRIFDRETRRVGRAAKAFPVAKRANTSLRSALRKKIETLRATRSDEKTVVFFGDGTFSCTSKGHISIPKKSILKALATRGLTFLLDEYNTSKQCPCGTSLLKDQETATSGSRLRCHQTTGPGSTCCVLDAIGSSNMDRDTLAVINLAQCAACALKGLKRPGHLCRTE